MQRRKALIILVTVVCCALWGGITGCTKRARKSVTVNDASSLSRADPGYVQWLERQAMVYQSSALTQIVSGSSIPWRKPYIQNTASQLRNEASVWLSLHAGSVLTGNGASVFSWLQQPEFWRQISLLGIHGLYLSPVRESGGLWGHDGDYQLFGEDTVAYSFAKHAGTEKEYLRLLGAANRHGAILADDLIPAATGLGADFFLAARSRTAYAGVYALIEVPQKFWEILPASLSRWQVEPLSQGVVDSLRQKLVLPAPCVREQSHLPFPPVGWAVTGEILGIDGVKRRFIYLYHDEATRPILHWNDPSAAARKIFSGSAIQEVGMLGTALVGIQVAPFIGLEPHGGDDSTIGVLAEQVARNVAQEVRRYGGWSMLRDVLPVSLLPRFLKRGPDFVVDHALATAAQFALLTGDASLLRSTLQYMQEQNIAQERVVHSIQPTNGIVCSPLLFAEATLLDGRSLGELFDIALTRFLVGITAKGGDVLMQGDTMHTTPVGLAAYASGVRKFVKATPEQKQEMAKGMAALVAFHAMQPGVFMLSGRDLMGTLPLPHGVVPAVSAKEALVQNTLGAYDLFGRTRGALLSPMGVPKAKAAFGPLLKQAAAPYSFMSQIQPLLHLRKKYAVADAQISRYPASKGAGCVLWELTLPDNMGHMLVAVNLGKERAFESVSLSAGTQITDVLGDGDGMEHKGDVLLLTLQPWESKVFICTKNTEASAR